MFSIHGVLIILCCVCIYLNRSSLTSSKYKTANIYLQRNLSASADSPNVPNRNYPPTFIPPPLPPSNYHPFLTQYNAPTETTNTNRTFFLNENHNEFLYRNSNSNGSNSIELTDLPNEFFAEVLDFSEEKVNETQSPSNNHFSSINLNTFNINNNNNNRNYNNENYSPSGGSIVLESRNIEFAGPSTSAFPPTTTLRPTTTTTTVPSTTSRTVETSTNIKPSGFALPKDYTRKHLETYTTPNPNTDNSLIKKYLGPLYFEAIEPTTYSPAFKKILKLFHQNVPLDTLSTPASTNVAESSRVEQSQLHRQQPRQHFTSRVENVTNHDTKSPAPKSSATASASLISIDFQYSTPRNLIFKEILTQTFGPKSTTKPTVSPYLSLEAQKSHSSIAHDTAAVAAAVANVNKQNEYQRSSANAAQYPNYYTKERNSVVSDVFSSVLSDKKSSSESRKGLDIILEITKIEPTTKIAKNPTSNKGYVSKSSKHAETDQRIPAKSSQTKFVSSERTNSFTTEKPFYYIRFKNTSFVPAVSTELPADRLSRNYYEYLTTSTASPLTRSHPPSRRFEEVRPTTTTQLPTRASTTTTVAPQTTTSSTTTSTTTTELPPVVTSKFTFFGFDNVTASSLAYTEILTTTTTETTVLPTTTGTPPRNLTPQRASRINNSIKTSIASGVTRPGTVKCNEVSANAKCNEISRPLRYYDKHFQ